MPYQASAVAGRQLKMTGSSPPSYTLIPGLTNLQYTNRVRNEINTTAISDEDEQFVPGRRAAASVTFSLFVDYANAQHVALLANYNNNGADLLYFQDVFDDSGDTELAWIGYVTRWEDAADVDGANMVNVSIKVTGTVNYTP